MAYNSIGEFYAGAGLLGVFFFVVVMGVSLITLAALMQRSRWNLTPVIAVVAALVAFYSYRNSVAVTAGFIRNIVWPYLMIWLLAKSFSGAGRSQKVDKYG
ncbi:hypothetical protein GCM10028792_31150 [Salinisphaera aquimarina]